MEKDISCLNTEYLKNNKNNKNYLSTLSSKEDERGWEKLVSKVFEFKCNIYKNKE